MRKDNQPLRLQQPAEDTNPNQTYGDSFMCGGKRERQAHNEWKREREAE